MEIQADGKKGGNGWPGYNAAHAIRNPAMETSGTPAELALLSDLQHRQATGAALEYLYFWDDPPAGPMPGRECLSQWHAREFQLAGTTYPTAEHYMMAEKARLFGDRALLECILAAPDPGFAKALGRQVRHFSEARWQSVRYGVVLTATLARFGQHPDLKAYLLGTGTRILVQASPLDAIWGMGLAATHRDAGNPSRWPGLNLLGFALMETRRQLAAAS